ncbi:MAG: hypothetical protein LBG11_06785 [Bifidobacteriaceae bacterium]|jgi:hypothetical protein|nr:hypothetical protein [Bifidobacteriaceae bacterium]
MWLQIIGWAGSALLVYSVLQVRVMRFRVANMCSCVVLAFFNAMIEAWPMVGMNVALTLINAYFIVKLFRDKRKGKAFQFALARPGDQVVTWFAERHHQDIVTFYPGIMESLADPAVGGGTEAALLFHEDAAIGLVVFSIDPTDPAFGELMGDYVVPSYRDYTPGRFVFSAGGPLAAAGIHHIRSDWMMPPTTKYLRAMGFAEAGDGRLARSIGVAN